MKIQSYLSVAAAVLLTAGCGTVGVQQGSGRYDTPAGTPEEEALIAREKTAVQVRSTAPVSVSANNVQSLVQGELARAGFAVESADPFIKIDLYPQFTLRDSFGNYRVYDGFCGLTVCDDRGKVLTKEEVKATGKRELEDSRALLSVQEKLAADAASRVVALCNEKTTGIETVLVTFKRRYQWNINEFAERMREKRGILSCRRLSEKETHDGNEVQYRVIFDSRHFPDGIRQVVEHAARRF